MDQRLVVHDSFSSAAPRMITMEPWHEVIFMAADGVHTVEEFVRHMGSQYKGGTPAGLREQMHNIINELTREGVLRLHEQAERLPPYFAEEFFKASADVRKAQMEADGIICGPRRRK